MSKWSHKSFAGTINYFFPRIDELKKKKKKRKRDIEDSDADNGKMGVH